MERYTGSMASLHNAAAGGDPGPPATAPPAYDWLHPPLQEEDGRASPAQGLDDGALKAHPGPSRWTFMGPAASATSAPGPSEAFTDWVIQIERRAEDRLLHQARERLSHCQPGAESSLYDFKCWLSQMTKYTDELTPRVMRDAQLRAWLLGVLRRRHSRRIRAGGELDCFSWSASGIHVPDEVKACIDSYVGGTHVWGPVTADRARAIAESSIRRLQRYEGVLRTAALAVLGERYVHPAVIRAAELGYTECSTEVPTNDLALQALFEVSAAEAHPDVGSLLVANLAKDGFTVKQRYHDPAYGLWRAFWVDQCDRLSLLLQW